MFIEQLKNGKYRVGDRYRDPITGKLKKVSVTVPDKKKSTLKAAQQTLIEKVNSKIAIPSKKCTINDLKVPYTKFCYSVLTEQTAIRNEREVDSAIKMLGGDAIIENLTAGYIKSKLMAEKDTASGRNEFIKRFKAFIRWGYLNDYVDDIRFIDKLVSFPDKESKQKIQEKYMEEEELALLMSGLIVEDWKTLCRMLLLTGMRIGEAMALTASDIDLKERYIHINKTWVLTTDKLQTFTKTDEGMRDVYIQDQLLPLCKTLRHEALRNKMIFKCDLLFQRNGKRIAYQTYAKYLRENTERILGRRLTSHAFRHTHVSMLAAEGLTLEEIQRRIGHAEDSDVTRRIYFHVTKKLKERDNARIKEIRIG